MRFLRVFILATTLVALSSALAQAQVARIDVDASAGGTPISPVLWGIFFEEINHAGDGGI